MNRPSSFRRHLLALCTFLVPLAVLAWIGFAELSRQADQARTAIDREALQFLRAAASALERRFDGLLPQLAQASETELDAAEPAAAVRTLRARGYGALLDIVMVDDDGALRYPEPGTQRLGLPFHRDGTSRSGDDQNAELLHLVDLLLTRGRYEDAARHLRPAVAEFAGGAGRRRDTFAQEVPLTFRLATVERKLGNVAAAQAAFRRVSDFANEWRGSRMGRGFDRLFDSDVMGCGLLAELALAEEAEDAEPRLDLLQAIARGDRDQLGEGLLQAVAERAAAAVSPMMQPRAAELLEEVGIHLRTRAFAADYESLLQETVRRRLRARPTSPAPANGELRQIIAAGDPNVLLLLRPARGQELERAAWIGLRLDLGQLLAAVVEPFVRSDSTFALAIADLDGQPIVAPPPAPQDYSPPALSSHGMMLTAWPADVANYLADTRAAERSSVLLLLFLFAVAASGALWLWRSVSRESELLALKVDLVSRVSHELKTPLSLISLYGETLQLKRARDADQAAHFGGVIAREASRLTTMIQRLLDFSRQEAGTLVYHRSPNDLGAALREIAATYAPHLQNRGATVETDLAVGVMADVDHSAFASVIVNLLDNAAKYGDEQRPDPSLRIELRRAGDRAEIDVLDRGRGIPASEHEKVFDSFYRASNAGEVRGAGLGLSLVRHFAVAHAGTITAMPRPGGGSIFRLSLPAWPEPR